MTEQNSCEIKVVGGGIAGLTAALFAARAGARVELYESVSEPGGRARTREDRGFHFDMGPHALYKGSSAGDVLRELDLWPAGGSPPVSGSLARYQGRLHALPGGAVSLLSTGLLRLPEKLETARFLGGLAWRDLSEWDGRTLREVLDTEFRHERVRQLVEATVRLSTYANAPELASAGAALTQLQLALKGVQYLDGGWRRMVNALADAARATGVTIHTGERVRAVECEGAVRGLRLAGERRVDATRVILAMGPGEASALVASGNDPVFREWAERSLPARAASFQVGLSRVPVPRQRFALGIDEPTYFSFHTPFASGVAPEGCAVVHAARYLAPDEKPERDVLEKEFEALFDQMQPGWRDAVVTRKLLLDLRVAHAIPTAAGGGLAGRPKERVAHIEGLFVCGDWVGERGQLVDASFASAREAGRLAGREATS